MIANEMTLTEEHIRYELTRLLQPIAAKYEKEINNVSMDMRDRFIADIADLMKNVINDYLWKTLAFKCDVHVFRVNNEWNFNIERSFTMDRGIK